MRYLNTVHVCTQQRIGFYLIECFYFYQVRIFTFSVGQHNYDKGPIQWMACSNKGAYGPLYTSTNTHAQIHTHLH